MLYKILTLPFGTEKCEWDSFNDFDFVVFPVRDYKLEVVVSHRLQSWFLVAVDEGCCFIKVDLLVGDELGTLQQEDIARVVTAGQSVVANLIILHTYFVFFIKIGICPFISQSYLSKSTILPGELKNVNPLPVPTKCTKN